MSAENLQIPYELGETRRPISPGAEKHIGEVMPILDHGFIYLVDYMGGDESIEKAARTSYGGGTRKVNETRGLIRYLMRHDHTTPFEMAEFKFHAKMPIFVARQWVRHRTASINEASGRYSILDKEFYLPESEVIANQSKTNRQGRGEVVGAEEAEVVRKILIEDAAKSYDHYQYMLNDDGKGNVVDPSRDMISRELARMNLSLNFYTQWYWKTDLHNLFHFLFLRKDEHAQWEIRQYADAMGKIIEDSVPLAWEAFSDYQLNAIKLSKQERNVIANLIGKRGAFENQEVIDAATEVGIKDKYELAETLSKFSKLGLLK